MYRIQRPEQIPGGSGEYPGHKQKTDSLIGVLGERGAHGSACKRACGGGATRTRPGRPAGGARRAVIATARTQSNCYASLRWNWSHCGLQPALAPAHCACMIPLPPSELVFECGCSVPPIDRLRLMWGVLSWAVFY